jgi:hypothetical protein
MLFKDMIPVYSENHTKPVSTKFTELLIVKSGGTQLPLDFEGLIVTSVWVSLGTALGGFVNMLGNVQLA